MAVIGASDTPTSVGYTVLRNLIGSGFRGVVYPVNPKRESVQGIQAYQGHPQPAARARSGGDLHACDQRVPALVRSLGEAGTRGIVIISAGFREIGEEGRKLEEQIRDEQREVRRHADPRPQLPGDHRPGHPPECQFRRRHAQARGTSGSFPSPGPCAPRCSIGPSTPGIGFSYFVSVGNMLDVSMADLIDYFGSATETQSIILYIESITEAREFVSAARAFARTKPIVAYKAGRFAESAQAAASHTGAMAGVDAVYEAAFQRAGIERIFQIEDMFDCAELLARHQPPKGDRLAIITNAGGPGVMTTDALIDRDGKLAELSRGDDRQAQRIPAALLVARQPGRRAGRRPAGPLRQGPGDRAAGQGGRRRAGDSHAAGDDRSDRHGPGVGQGVAKSHKPVLAAWMGGHTVAEGIAIVEPGGHPHLRHARKGGPRLHAPGFLRPQPGNPPRNAPRDSHVVFAGPAAGARLFDTSSTEGQEILSENVSKTLLDAYEIPVTKPHVGPHGGGGGRRWRGRSAIRW